MWSSSGLKWNTVGIRKFAGGLKDSKKCPPTIGYDGLLTSRQLFRCAGHTASASIDHPIIYARNLIHSSPCEIDHEEEEF